MFIAQKTVTRYVDGKGTVMMVKGSRYSQDAMDKFPSYYMDWVTAA